MLVSRANLESTAPNNGKHFRSTYAVPALFCFSYLSSFNPHKQLDLFSKRSSSIQAAHPRVKEVGGEGSWKAGRRAMLSYGDHERQNRSLTPETPNNLLPVRQAGRWRVLEVLLWMSVLCWAASHCQDTHC